MNPRGVTMEIVEKSTGQVRRRRGESMESCCLRVGNEILHVKKLSSQALLNLHNWTVS